MVSGEGQKPDGTYLKAERRQAPRKSVSDSSRSAVILGPIGSFKPPREYPRKKPITKISAQLFAQMESNCVIQDLSENGLRINHTVKLTEGQTVVVFLRVAWEANKEGRGFTLICKVIRFKEFQGPEHSCHESGLSIVTKLDPDGFNKFVASLPPLEIAHA